MLQSFRSFCLVSFYRFAARSFLDEFVGEFGKFFCFQAVEFYCKDCSLTLQVFRLIIFGEGYVYVLGFADVHTDYLIFEARDELTAAKRQVKAFCFAAVKFNAVNAAAEVDVCDVAVYRCAVGYVYFTSVSVEYAVDFRLHLFFFYSIRKLLNFHTLVGRNFYFGFYGNNSNERYAFVFKLFNGYFGIADNRVFSCVFFQNLAIVFREKGVERFFVEYAFAVSVFDYVFGCFTFTETVDGKSVSQFKVCALLRCLPFFAVEFERDFYRALFCCFASVFHNCLLLSICYFIFLFYTIVYFTIFIKINKAFFARFYLQFVKIAV